MKLCPYCAEEIKNEAKKCKHCGEFLSKISTDVKKSTEFWYVSQTQFLLAIAANFFSYYVYYDDSNTFNFDSFQKTLIILGALGFFVSAVYFRLKIIGQSSSLFIIAFVPFLNIVFMIYLLLAKEEFSEKDYDKYLSEKQKKLEEEEEQRRKNRPKSEHIEKTYKDVIKDFKAVNKRLKSKHIQSEWYDGNLISLTIDSVITYPIVHTIPDSIGNLTTLETLDLSSNSITKIPDSIGNLTTLETLYLSSNKITEMPDSIGNLVELETLDLSSNSITKIPDSIGNLEFLSDLNISFNKITEIPDSIGNIEHLSYLDLSYNKITEIPDSIANLEYLVYLELNSNKIKDLEEKLAMLDLEK